MGINKRGNVLSAIMISLILFIVGMIVVNFFLPEVTTARTSLGCSNGAAITDGTKLLCLGVDLVVPYFFVLVLSIAGGVLLEKLLI